MPTTSAGLPAPPPGPVKAAAAAVPRGGQRAAARREVGAGEEQVPWSQEASPCVISVSPSCTSVGAPGCPAVPGRGDTEVGHPSAQERGRAASGLAQESALWPGVGEPWEPLHLRLGELRPSEKGAVTARTVALTTLC